ncbi:MAG TPA: putative glycoside hydrolase [Bacillota bacterium]|jgi:hypothetical protein|nr:putative glycoside hydrolase [Bacillota bacterium]HOL08879.1 putative glycoside hydrolase [Bacillota bacterium]HPO96572.1 putative glycoside hydrolase [Bacillota bacterium]
MTKKRLIIVIVSLVVISLIGWFCFKNNLPLQDSQASLAATPADELETESTSDSEPAPEEPSVKKVEWIKPEVIKGVYATGWMAGSEKWFPRIVQFINETEVNSLVIDVKDDTGTLSYISQVPLVDEVKSRQRKINDPQKMFEILKENNIYPIARVVVFKDPFMAKAKPEWAVKDINGGLWKDRHGLNWVDPYNKQYWDYIIAICKEAIEMGFQEIQFDYVRFTSDGDVKRCIYPFNNGNAKEDVIMEFLQYARTELKAYDIPISADIFGLTTSADADLGIGQRFEKIAANVDIVCPMVYPSHYIPGNFGLKNPNLAPYETVFRSVGDAMKRLEETGNTNTTIRPWLQDFSLGSRYGREQIQAQIKALNDLGIKEWLFWNPSCRYDTGKYNKAN